MEGALNYKPFSMEDMLDNDYIAKIAAVSLLESMGFTLKWPLSEQREAFKAHDFVINNPVGGVVPVEVERKLVWKQEGRWETDWKHVHVAKRKEDSQASLFVMLNYPCNTALVACMPVVVSSQIVYKKTIITEAEPFFELPVDKCKFFKRGNQTWLPINPNGRSPSARCK